MVQPRLPIKTRMRALLLIGMQISLEHPPTATISEDGNGRRFVEKSINI